MKDNGITKKEVHKSALGNKKGWAFSIYWNRPSPNLISGLYKTKKSATQALAKYLQTGRIEWYGDAE